jgi:hypothetical protein
MEIAEISDDGTHALFKVLHEVEVALDFFVRLLELLEASKR